MGHPVHPHHFKGLIVPVSLKNWFQLLPTGSNKHKKFESEPLGQIHNT